MMEKFHKTTSRAYILTTIPSEICLLLPLLQYVTSTIGRAVITYKNTRRYIFLSHDGFKLLLQICLTIIGRQQYCNILHLNKQLSTTKVSVSSSADSDRPDPDNNFCLSISEVLFTIAINSDNAVRPIDPNKRGFVPERTKNSTYPRLYRFKNCDRWKYFHNQKQGAKNRKMKHSPTGRPYILRISIYESSV